MPQLSDVEKEVRKLRKKLRQIENLERQEFDGRELSEEEENKILKKIELRKTLKDYLLRYEDELQNPTPYQDVTASTISDSSFQSPDLADPESDKEEYHADGDISEDEESESDECDVIVPTAPTETEPVSEAIKESDGEEWQMVGQKKESHSPKKQSTPIPSSSKDLPESKNKKTKTEKRASEPPKAKSVSEPPLKQKKGATSTTNESHKAKTKELSPSDRLKQEWLQQHLTVFLLEGHNDLVTAIHLDKDCLISGSRDTMVKIWNTTNGFEEKSFGGHTDTITAVLLLPLQSSQVFREDFELSETDRLVVSASLDCSIKLWSLETGKQCLSMYTYNPITSIAFLDGTSYIICGTGGGKVELWDIKTKSSVQSCLTHDGAVNQIKTVGSMVYSAGADGIIKVYALRENKLVVLHCSDDVKCQSGSPLALRPVRSLAVKDDLIFYGDDGTNVKVLDWKKGQVHKLKNHSGEFGSSDGMCCENNLLAASGYDLGEGIGYINIWSLPGERYICTLRDESFMRFMTLRTAVGTGGKLLFATGGSELRLWVPTVSKSSEEFIIRGEHMDEFCKKPVDSDLDTDGEMSDSEPETSSFFWSRKQRPNDQTDEGEVPGWFSWCSVL